MMSNDKNGRHYSGYLKNAWSPSPRILSAMHAGQEWGTKISTFGATHEILSNNNLERFIYLCVTIPTVTMSRVEFAIADYAVFGVTILISLGIGIYYALSGGQQKTTSEYLVGNRQMQILPVALSLMVSFESSIMMLGFPAETYVYGVMFWLSNIGFLVANLIGVRIVVPLVHPLRLTSVYEYFEMRYKSRAVRLLGTCIGGLGTIFYMGIVLFGPGIALEAVTNFPLWASILLVALASVIYTSIGGIKAVIWTDVFQSLIMFMGVFAILIKGCMVSGGIGKVFEIGGENGRLNFFDFNPDPTVRHTFWNLVFGSCIRMTTLTFNQTSVQRISAMRTQSQANKVLLLAGPAFFITLTLASLEGLVAFAYFYTMRCDPLESKTLRNPNQVVPYMVLDMFRNLPGMPGIFMAALFSASLSTLSSGLSSLSAITTADFVRPYFKDISEKKATLIAKISVWFYGCLAVAVSFMIAKIKGPMSQISFSVLSAFGGPASGLFLYSAFCPWATKKGALIGTILGVIFMFWLSTGSNFSKTLKRTPYLHPAPTDRCVEENITYSINNINTTYPHPFMEYSEDMTTFAFPETTYTEPEPEPEYKPQGLDKFYSLSYQWFGAVGLFFTIIISSIVSFIEGPPDPETVDVRYVLPFFDQLFPFLPKKLRKILYCGIKFEERAQRLAEMDKGIFEETIKLMPPDITVEDGSDGLNLNLKENGIKIKQENNIGLNEDNDLMEKINENGNDNAVEEIKEKITENRSNDCVEGCESSETTQLLEGNVELVEQITDQMHADEIANTIDKTDENIREENGADEETNVESDEMDNNDRSNKETAKANAKDDESALEDDYKENTNDSDDTHESADGNGSNESKDDATSDNRNENIENEHLGEDDSGTNETLNDEGMQEAIDESNDNKRNE